MAVKTFSVNEVLTAADTNTYLANAGLVFIKESVVTSGTGFNITNCFSATYDSYKVVISNFTSNADVGLTVEFLVGTTPTQSGYYYYYTNQGYTSASTYSQIGASNAASFSPLAISGTGNAGGGTFDLFNPYLATTTTIQGARLDPRTTGSGGFFMGYQSSLTSFDGLRFTTSSVNITNIRVRVYGYRQA